jgi:DNA-binding NarL/FixJ family response regulator
MPAPIIKVALVEDDADVRAQHAALFQQSPGFQCAGAYKDAEAALAGIPKSLPDVVLMDIGLPDMSGIECVRQIKAAHPSIQFVMLTVFEDADKILASLIAGASGYLLKRASAEDLLKHIIEVFNGGSPMTSVIARKVVQHFHAQGRRPNALAKLSPREQQILEHLARGAMYKEIASDLRIEIDTVSKHLRNIYTKLQVRSRTEAVVKYLRER